MERRSEVFESRSKPFVSVFAFQKERESLVVVRGLCWYESRGLHGRGVMNGHQSYECGLTK